MQLGSLRGAARDMIRVTSLDESIHAMQYFCQETKASPKVVGRVPFISSGSSMLEKKHDPLVQTALTSVDVARKAGVSRTTVS